MSSIEATFSGVIDLADDKSVQLIIEPDFTDGSFMKAGLKMGDNPIQYKTFDANEVQKMIQLLDKARLARMII